MSFAFNIPFKVERGESMKTVKVTIENQSENMYLWSAEIERLASEAGVKNGIVWFSGTDSPRQNMPLACTLINGYVAGKYSKSFSTSASFDAYAGMQYQNNQAVFIPNASNWTADSRVGDEYTIAVVDIPWVE